MCSSRGFANLSKEKDKSDNAVIDLEHARVRLRSRATVTPESLNQDLEGVRGLLDQGLTIEARTWLNSLLSEARNQPELLAEARRSLSIALEMQGNYRESLEAVAMYEAPEARTKLNPTLGTLLRVQIALANNYNGDHPKAISLLKATLRGLPQEGIRFLEKAISYYERTDHKNNAADGYNNLGMNLVLIGQWDRAQEALERALSIASETGEHGAQVSMILDSLGELLMLRGDFEEACTYLGLAVTLSAKNGNTRYEGQAQRTLGRCYVAMRRGAEALTTTTKSQPLAEEIGDRQAICESHLLLAEACLECGDTEGCGANLDRLTQLITDSPADLLLAGEAQRLHGLLTMVGGRASPAAQHFGRTLSLF